MRTKIFLILILFFTPVCISTAQVDVAGQQKSDEITESSLNSFDDSNRNDSTFLATIQKKVQNNLAPKDSVKGGASKSKSFFNSDLFYFIGSAAIAAIVYILLPDDNADAEKKLTFGKPPAPK